MFKFLITTSLFVEVIPKKGKGENWPQIQRNLHYLQYRTTLSSVSAFCLYSHIIILTANRLGDGETQD